MRNTREAVLAFALVLPRSSALSAQDSLVPQPGSIVRLTLVDRSQNSGPLVRMDSSGILFAHFGRDTTTIPWDLVRRIDVRVGHKSAALLGAGTGFAALTVAGGLQGRSVATPGHFGPVLEHAIIGGAIGALLGAGIGTVFKTDRWREVPLEPLLQRLRAPPFR